MIKDSISVTGTPTFTLTDGKGAVKSHFQIKNLVVTVGKNLIAEILQNPAAIRPSRMALGTGTAAANSGNSTLGAELARAVLSSTSVSLNTVTYRTVFIPGVGTGAITEAGILNAATGGVLLARCVFPVINKEAPDTLTVAWDVTIN